MDEIFLYLNEVYKEKPDTHYTLNNQGLFVASQIVHIYEVLNKCNVGSGVEFLDLGSGDGRVILTSALLGAHSTGIESDKDLYNLSLDIINNKSVKNTVLLENCKKNNFEFLPEQSETHYNFSLNYLERINVLNDDFFRHDLKNYDVIFYYGGGCALKQNELYKKVCTEIKASAKFIVFRTEKVPDIELSISDLSNPPFYTIFIK